MAIAFKGKYGETRASNNNKVLKVLNEGPERVENGEKVQDIEFLRRPKLLKTAKMASVALELLFAAGAVTGVGAVYDYLYKKATVTKTTVAAAPTPAPTPAAPVNSTQAPAPEQAPTTGQSQVAPTTGAAAEPAKPEAGTPAAHAKSQTATPAVADEHKRSAPAAAEQKGAPAVSQDPAAAQPAAGTSAIADLEKQLQPQTGQQDEKFSIETHQSGEKIFLIVNKFNSETCRKLAGIYYDEAIKLFVAGNINGGGKAGHKSKIYNDAANAIDEELKREQATDKTQAAPAASTQGAPAAGAPGAPAAPPNPAATPAPQKKPSVLGKLGKKALGVVEGEVPGANHVVPYANGAIDAAARHK